MADVLAVLRDATLNKRPVTLDRDSDEIVIGSFRYPRSTKTGLVKKGSNEVYLLDAVWLCLQMQEKQFTEYWREAVAQKIQPISVVDRRELLDFLTGKTDSLEGLVPLTSVGGAGVSAGAPAAATAAGFSTSAAAAGAAPSSSSAADLTAASAGGVLATKRSADEHAGEDARVKRGRPQPGEFDAAQIVPKLTAEQRARIDADLAELKMARLSEQRLVTRSSVLTCQKTFSSILQFLRDEQRRREQEQQAAKPQGMPGRHDRYNLEEKHFWQGRAEFGDVSDLMNIDTMGTAFGARRPGAAPAPAAPPATAAAAAAAATAPAAGSGPTPAAAAAAPGATRPSSGARAAAAASSTRREKSGASATGAATTPGKSKPLGKPIIIVPAGATMVTRHNVKEFLESGKFVDPMEARKSTNADDYIVVKHNVQGKPLLFKVVDSTAGFTPQDWDRVVAVFTNGQAWQFRDWKWPEATELFANVVGFYAHWDDVKLPETIQRWDVRKLPISRHKRFLDAKLAQDVWSSIETYMLKRKREYLA